MRKVAIAVLFLVAACNSQPAATSAPSIAPSVAPSGSLTAHAITGTWQYPTTDDGCAALTTIGSLNGISPTTQVSLTDEAGTILAVTQLGPTTFPGCFFRFTFGQVPGGPTFYSVQIAQRPKTTVSAADLASAGWQFRLPAGTEP